MDGQGDRNVPGRDLEPDLGQLADRPTDPNNATLPSGWRPPRSQRLAKRQYLMLSGNRSWKEIRFAIARLINTRGNSRVEGLIEVPEGLRDDSQHA
jgi:hypothetical protein